MENKQILDIYKHRRLDEGQWQYSCWVNSYWGPYSSIEKLAEALSDIGDLINIRLVSRREKSIESGEQVSPVSEDELAEIYHSIIKNRRQRILEGVSTTQ